MAQGVMEGTMAQICVRKRSDIHLPGLQDREGVFTYMKLIMTETRI